MLYSDNIAVCELLQAFLKYRKIETSHVPITAHAMLQCLMSNKNTFTPNAASALKFTLGALPMMLAILSTVHDMGEQFHSECFVLQTLKGTQSKRASISIFMPTDHK